jgi:hypothetical protein
LNPENCIGTVNHSPQAATPYDVPQRWIEVDDLEKSCVIADT